MDVVLSDLRYALRNFRQAPIFFSLVIGILAAGIGISVSIFSLVDGVLLRPFPYKDPGRLVTLTTFAPRPPFESNGSVSYDDFEQLKAKSHSFSDLAVTFRSGWSRVTLTGGAEPLPMQGAFTSSNLFALVGRSPILGRTFTADESLKAERVVVISQGLWAQHFGSAQDVLGQDLEIDHVKWRVIGVMPQDFQVPFLRTEIWAPVLAHPGWNDQEEDRPRERARWDVMGRLRPGVSLQSAQAEIDSIWSGLRAALPDFHTNDIRVLPLREHFTADMRKPLLVLFCAVGLMLLIACANVANLLLARAMRREHEISVRSALGAGRGRIFQQLLTEALTLSGIAGALGVFAAIQFVPLLKAFSPVETSLLDAVEIDTRVLLFAFGLSLVLGLLLGIAPLSHALRRVGPKSFGVAGGRATETRGSRRWKSVLVIAEFTLTMVLVSGAGLLIQSFFAVLNVDLGFRPENVLTAQIGIPSGTSPARALQFCRDVLQRISLLPGVVATGAAGNLFFLDERRSHALRQVEGHAPEPVSSWKPLVWTQVAGDYFRAMGIPLVEGRFFNDRDRPNSPPVVIVNQTLARRYWPGEDPLGKRLKGFDPRGQHDDWLTVVGVVKDTRSGGLEKAPFSQIYEVQAQRPSEQVNSFVIRSAGTPAELGNSVRKIIRNVNSNASISDVTTMQSLLDHQMMSRRFQTWLISIFSGASLVLAALGIFALMHYAVAARTSEIGIRMAVGANRSDIVRLVLGNSTRLAATGIAVGGLAALAATKAIAGMLYGVQWYDPVNLLTAAGLLLIAALLASYLPSYRASQIQPLSALRQE